MLTLYDQQQMAMDKARAAKRDRERVAELEAFVADVALGNTEYDVLSEVAERLLANDHVTR